MPIVSCRDVPSLVASTVPFGARRRMSKSLLALAPGMINVTAIGEEVLEIRIDRTRTLAQDAGILPEDIFVD